MDDEGWEILEEIEKHDLSQALVPLSDPNRYELLQQNIQSNVISSIKDVTLADSLVNELLESAKYRVTHPDNQLFHGELASEAYSHGVLIDAIRRAGRVFEEVKSPHLGHMHDSFSREVYTAKELESFLHEIATVLR